MSLFASDARKKKRQRAAAGEEEGERALKLCAKKEKEEERKKTRKRKKLKKETSTHTPIKTHSELLRVRNYVNAVLCGATGKPLAEVQRDFNRNKYFSAEEALAYGIIDKILPPPRTIQEELAEAQSAAAKGKGRPVAGPKKGVGY